MNACLVHFYYMSIFDQEDVTLSLTIVHSMSFNVISVILSLHVPLKRVNSYCIYVCLAT